MNPVKFEGANDVIGGPRGTTEEQVGSLIVHRGADSEFASWPVITSAWELTPEEREEFLKTGRIYLRVWSDNLFPLSLSVFNPVEQGWVKNGRSFQPNHPLLKKDQ